MLFRVKELHKVKYPKICFNCSKNLIKEYNDDIPVWRNTSNPVRHYCNDCKTDIFEGVKLG